MVLLFLDICPSGNMPTFVQGEHDMTPMNDIFQNQEAKWWVAILYKWFPEWFDMLDCFVQGKLQIIYLRKVCAYSS